MVPNGRPVTVWIRSLLATLASVLSFAPSATAQSTSFETKAGVVVPVPAGFHEAQRDSLLLANSPFIGQAEAVFLEVDGDHVVSMMIYDIPVRSSRAALAALPGTSGAASQSQADAVLTSLLQAAPDLRKDATATALLYDNARKAVGVEIKATELSLAHLMLLQPDTSNAWQQIAKEGEPVTVVRCLMNTIAQSLDRGDLAGSAPAAARACKVKVEDATNYVRLVGKRNFEPRHSIARVVQVVTAKGASGVMFDADTASESLLDPAWQTVWTGIGVRPEAVAPRGITSRLSLASYGWWVLLSACIGAPVVALLLGLLLGRLVATRVKQTVLAASLGQGIVLVLALSVGHGAVVDGSLTGLGLVYLIAVVVTFPATCLLLRGFQRAQPGIPASARVIANES